MNGRWRSIVMAGLDPAIHRHSYPCRLILDGRIKCGHDSKEGAAMTTVMQRMKGRYIVYILASKRNGTLYIGVTNNLTRRSYEHREGKGSIFTKRYRVHNLVYAEEFSDVTQAIQRESNLKHWPRRWKIELIEKLNPEWADLYETIV